MIYRLITLAEVPIPVSQDSDLDQLALVTAGEEHAGERGAERGDGTFDEVLKLSMAELEKRVIPYLKLATA